MKNYLYITELLDNKMKISLDISFEENMFDALGLSVRCSDFKALSATINTEVSRIKDISAEERKKRITALLSAIIQEGFWIDDPLKVTGDAPGSSNEEAYSYGAIIADAVKRYVEKYPRAGKEEPPGPLEEMPECRR